MTFPETARRSRQAAAIGDTGQVPVLDMGGPVKSVELAREPIRLAGQTPDESRSSSPACCRAGRSLRNCWPRATPGMPSAQLRLASLWNYASQLQAPADTEVNGSGNTEARKRLWGILP